jgi:hypothetical protein
MGKVHPLVRQARQVCAAAAPDVPSPCASICRMDPASELCEGCFRTLAEIAGWARMEDEEKREVWRMIGQRALTVVPAQTGNQIVERLGSPPARG